MLRSAILCLLLAASTAWVYWDTLRFDFVSYDDPGYVVNNPYVAQGTSRVGLSPARDVIIIIGMCSSRGSPRMRDVSS